MKDRPLFKEIYHFDGTPNSSAFSAPDFTIEPLSEIDYETSTDQPITKEPERTPQETAQYQRIVNMKNLRIRLAQLHSLDSPVISKVIHNNDYVGLYHKGLPHSAEGLVDNAAMKTLLDALGSRDLKLLNKVPLASNTKLVNPSASWSQDIFGACNNVYERKQSPLLHSNTMAAQMVELYCMALARDVKFHDYTTSPIIARCCEYLNKLQSYPYKATPYNIFRGPMHAETQGPYISQFLYLDVMSGGFNNVQKYNTDVEDRNYLTTWESAIAAQNGTFTIVNSKHEKPRYIITGRDLATYCHFDEHCQAFTNAAMILLNMKAPLNRTLPVSSVESSFVDMGRPDLFTMLHMVGRSALSAAWYVKWNTMFLRPEAYGIEVERVFRENKNIYGISNDVLKNPVLHEVRRSHGNCLLSQAYSEGSPLHPSDPSGHAAIAGACATVLKFFFETSHEMDVYKTDGETLTKTDLKSTVGDEIHKLACNTCLGRNWAGIHYATDAVNGLRLGEQVALKCLQDLVSRYNTSVSVTITLLNGTKHTITTPQNP